jgi:hypothetical protein
MSEMFRITFHRRVSYWESRTILSWFSGTSHVFTNAQLHRNIQLPKRVDKIEVVAYRRYKPNRFFGRVQGISYKGIYIENVIGCKGKKGSVCLSSDHIDRALRELSLYPGDRLYFEVEYE